MSLLITNAIVCTMDDERRILRNGAVAIDGDRIVDVGASDELAVRHADAERIDGMGKAIIPGFINSHTHTVLLVLRGTVEDMDGNEIYGYMQPISFAMTPDERGAIARLGCLEAIRSGTTTLVDPFRHVAGYAQTMANTGVRLFLSESGADALTLLIRKGIYEYDRAFGEESLERVVALVEGFHGGPEARVQCQIAAHGSDTCSPWMLRELMDLAEKHGLRRTIHLAQSRAEVDQMRAARNATPAEYLRDQDWLAPDLVGAHWTFCTESDIDLLAERGVHMAHCPASSSVWGPHRVNIGHILDVGVNVALGTDNMSEDMFQNLKVANILHRGGHGGGADPGPQQILDGATRDAARALGREHDLGTIAPGTKADLVILDLEQAHLTPSINLVSNLVHYATPNAVESVMVDGEFLMRDGVVLSINERDTLAAAREATVAAWRRLHENEPDVEIPAGLLDG